MPDFSDIKEGDRVRMVFEVTAMEVGRGGSYLRTDENIYYAYEGEGELVSVETLEQPLPTEDGWYESEQFPLNGGCAPYLLSGGRWSTPGGGVLSERYMQSAAAPLYKLGRV